MRVRVYAKTGNSGCAEITVSSFEQPLSVFIDIKHTKHAHIIHPLPRNPGCMKNNTRCTFGSLYHTRMCWAGHQFFKNPSSYLTSVCQNYKMNDWKACRQNHFECTIFLFLQHGHWHNLSESLKVKTYRLWPEVNGWMIKWQRVGVLPFYSIQFSTITFNKKFIAFIVKKTLFKKKN